MELDGVQLTESDYLRDDQWAPDILPYSLWYEYLAWSPSFEFARRNRAGELTTADKAKLPADFQKVLKVFDDFGDVRNQKFLTWWRNKGMDLCAVKGQKPETCILDIFENSSEGLPEPNERVSKYIEEEWVAGGKQNTILLAIPLGLSKAKISRDISSIFEELPNEIMQLEPREPTYALAGKRVSINMLQKYLRVLKIKTILPDLSLWRLGALTQVSNAYNKLEHWNSRIERDASDMKQNPTAQEKRTLTILTSRAIKRSLLIAENAARGRFPVYSDFPDAINTNLDELLEMRNVPHSEAIAKKLNEKYRTQQF